MKIIVMDKIMKLFASEKDTNSFIICLLFIFYFLISNF